MLPFPFPVPLAPAVVVPVPFPLVTGGCWPLADVVDKLIHLRGVESTYVGRPVPFHTPVVSTPAMTLMPHCKAAIVAIFPALGFGK
jgi:hypothetical protein